MADPLSISVLAGSALTQAFGFLYGRLAALLDRRAAEQKARELTGEESKIISGEVPNESPDRAILTQHREQLELLADALETYLSEPQALASSNGALRNLERLRGLLEEIYGRYITFVGEERPTSGLRISQKITQVEGEVLGLDADDKGSSGHIEQNIHEVRQSGTVIGARIRRVN